jgi:hypothetical protein
MLQSDDTLFNFYFENVDKFGRILPNNLSKEELNHFNRLCSDNYDWQSFVSDGYSTKLLSSFYIAYCKNKKLSTTNINDDNLIYLCESFEPSPYINSFIENMSSDVFTKLKNGNIRIVFNWAGEALYDERINSSLELEFAKYNLNVNSIFILTSANNIKNTSNINYISDHFFLQNSANSLKLFLTQTSAKNMNNDFDWNSEIVSYDIFTKYKSKHFISLNRQISRPHRYAFGLFVEKHNLWDKGYFSFLHMMDNVTQCFETLSMNDFNSYGDIHDSFKSKIPIHLDTIHLLDKTKMHNFRVSEIYYKPAYEDSVINIVTETAFSNNKVFMSEKTFHPIINLQPFIIFSSNGHLAELKRLGFKTFDGFIDESYDMEENSQKRFKMVCDEILRLSQMDISELNKLYLSYKEIYIHNRQHLLKFTNYDYYYNCLQKIKKYGI